ncbi:YsnF/AvaK domain-containing protein [Arthrobacter sp. SX1312]|uniref:YsnF/AvaK domain-containing protein n=1 Tax=Arthrobacter sp. SX1312 TaxID=2058896 RepID=UPI000CE42662|nr:YsnF/AvaK domain-containing protein [Arthrobacter sp. SX1312]
MITQNDIDTILSGRGHVLDSHGSKIGSVGQVYLDDQTQDPSWVTVKTGLFGTSESFAPLQGANVNGNDVTIGYTKDQVKDAPRIESDGDLSPEEEDRLYRHYGLSGHTTGTPAGTTGKSGGDFLDSDTTRTTNGTAGYEAGYQAGDERHDRSGTTVGHDTSGPTTDDAMTRSEEQLHVGTERREAGRARLRKYVVTENVTKTVPVTHEEVRIEREPITDANRGDALDGPSISEEEHEVVLHAERPVVEKEAVPVERVRLDKETVTAQETVTEEVRKEKIEVLDADGTDVGDTTDGTGRRTQ